MPAPKGKEKGVNKTQIEMENKIRCDVFDHQDTFMQRLDFYFYFLKKTRSAEEKQK